MAEGSSGEYMAKFKGTIYMSTALFLQKRFGADAPEQVLANMPDEDRALLRSVTAVGWYPAAPINAFQREMDRQLGHGDLDLCFEAGQFSAEWTLNMVLKMLLRFRTPEWLFDRSTTLWPRFHDSGRWEMGHSKSAQLVADLHEFEARDEAFCERFRGWLWRAIELTGGRDPDVQHVRCACRRGDVCRWEASWS